MSISTLSLPSHAAYHMAIPSAHGLTSAPLTQILLTHNPHLFSLATTSPFLHSAGLGTLPKSTLSKWLSQDRLYAQSYISFIGALLSRVHLPHAYIRDKSASLRWKIATLLTNALNNIMRELEFFEEVAEKYGLDLEATSASGSGFQAASATRQYEALFRAFGSDSSMSLLEGLVVLWATEQVYLSAWRYARSQGQGRTSHSSNRGYSNTGMSASGGLPRALSGLSVTGSDVGSVSGRQSQSPPPNYNGSGNNGYGNDYKDASGNLSSTQPAPTELSTPANDEKHSNHSYKPPSQRTPDPEPVSPPEHGQTLSPPLSPAPQPVAQYAHDLDGGALRSQFIPNWTSPEFERFVQDIADVTDELAEREEAWRRIDVYKAVWEHILEVERRFWPDIGVSH
jgi:thiaminase